MNNNKFVHAFENGSFPPSQFNHAAHIKLAWIYLNQFDEETAISKTCKAIQNFDKLHGDGTKFHTTLTVAAVKVVHHFKQKSNATNFEEFITEFPRLITSFKELLFQHYGKDVIADPKAKTTYLEPDLLPFN
ncbi:hypothetical protein Murru_3041 [Allomuricauda ruestringensis DSM 13258]|uniref:Uncharacterized protein n=1 Tax=Allomuricauda ruestringensis (strain DSM 13258 / CIP 107369 / LMG 19739 / B1) TaxID=886377 RepID=G2PKL6_ALLRU|nr:hypothetical protein [Allomuricauda ruestringensis]AEM72062.1 hypothetical protein Murru_3041 [Allomuricauda ruestringensis DSM 13258]